MPFKLGKCWSKTFFSAGAFAALGCVICIFPRVVSAAVSVTPINGGSASGTVFYYATTDLIGSSFPDPDPSFSFKLIDIKRTQNAVSYGKADTAGRPNLMLFSVFTDKPITFGSGQQPVLQITVNAGQGAGGTKPIPIAQVNGIDCGNTGSPCQAQGGQAGGTPGPVDGEFNNHFFAAQYAVGQTIQVGIYPQDICADYTKQVPGGSASGCTANLVTTPGTGLINGPTQMVLNFNFLLAPDSVQAPTGTAQDTVSGLTLSFQSDGPSQTCPDLSNIYFPGDGQILLDTSNFGLSILNGRAPATTLIAVTKEAGAVDLSTGFQANNTFVTRVNYGGQQAIKGFTNTTNGGDHAYNVAFLMRDAAGLVAPPVASCQLSNVQTSSIQGFLAKSNCFIATAAFRDIDAGPVVMLRAFRDRILLKSLPGKSFVRWYYGWSPGAAEWLMLHPEFRFPVLLALIPVQTAAWLALHPFLLAFLALAGLALFPLSRRLA